MVKIIIATLVSVFIVSIVSFIGALSLLLQKQKLSKALLLLVSLSAGTLFGGAFLHLLPEATEELGFGLQTSFLVLAGIVVFFILEKWIHYHHHHNHHEHEHPPLHEPHPHHIGVMNLLGDGLHNFIDGLIIAAAYFVSIPVGIATTIAVILHEIPQELADFGVLLYAGFSKTKALFFNFLSALIAIVGAAVGLLLGSASEVFVSLVLPFAAGGFVYIAGSNLIPELHKHCKLKESMWHLLIMLVGIALMFALLFLE